MLKHRHDLRGVKEKREKLIHTRDAARAEMIIHCEINCGDLHEA